MRERGSSVLHGMGSSGKGEVAFCDFGGAAREGGAECVGGMAREEFLEGLVPFAVDVEEIQEARDGVGDFVGGATIADGPGDGGDLADAAAYAEVIGIDHFAVELDFFTFDADVGDPVLAAGIGAASDVESKLLLIIGETVFELFGEPAGEGFGFGESELAEFGTGAGDGAANEGRRFDGKAGSGEFGDHRGDVRFGNVDQEKILHKGVADVAVTVTFGEIGGEVELRGSNASANDGGADGEEAGLLLRDDAEMVAMNLRRRLDGFGGIERKIETGLQGGEEGVGGPAVFEEKEFEAGLFTGLAEGFTFAEEFGDGADDGDDLIPRNESVDGDGEVRMRREAAADAEGEAEFGRSGEWIGRSARWTWRTTSRLRKACGGQGEGGPYNIKRAAQSRPDKGRSRLEAGATKGAAGGD